jgi:hypothetical protein
VHEVARALAIDTALGNSREGQLIARVIDQGSRLSSVRLARSHACAEILGLRGFDKDDLYANLDWLADRQAEVEKKLFEHQQAPQGLFLYALSDQIKRFFETLADLSATVFTLSTNTAASVAVAGAEG